MLLCLPGNIFTNCIKICLELLNHAMGYNFFTNFFFDKVKTNTLKLTKGLYPAPIQIAEVSLYSIKFTQNLWIYNMYIKLFGIIDCFAK